MPPPGHPFDAEYRSTQRPGHARAQVRFDVRGLVIDDGGSAAMLWPYASIVAKAPVLATGAAPVVLSSTTEPDATLTVQPSPAFAPSLLQSAPQLDGRSRGPQWLAMVAATLLCFGVAGALLWALLAQFPYKAVARRIPEDTRARIGQLALAEITKSHKRCEQQPGNAALSALVLRLARASGTDMEFKVQVVDWSLVNAFAVMGNQIILTRGLLTAATSPDEVAGVLGHEMGHVIEVHPEVAVLRALGTTVGLQVLFGGWTADLAGQAAGHLLALRYSRASETEADEVALRLLKGARIAAGPFAEFFDNIGRDRAKANGGLTVPTIFQTHPASPERARRVRAEPVYPAMPALSAAEWDALRRICD